MSQSGGDPGSDRTGEPTGETRDPAAIEAEIAALRRSLERQVGLGRRTAAELRRAESDLAEAKARLKATRNELNTLRQRVPVRATLAAARRAREVVVTGRSLRRRLPGGGATPA